MEATWGQDKGIDYHRGLKDFGVHYPLFKKDTKFEWSDECERALNTLNRSFCSAPILRHFDFNRPCRVEQDASDFVISTDVNTDG
jgi:hypothetical protein